MFIECHDAAVKYPYYINVDKVSDIHIKDYISSDDGKNYGFVLEAYVLAIPDGKKVISEIYHTQEDAEKALQDLVKKLNKHK